MAKIADLIPDEKNANKGTQRGLSALDNSLRQYGAGRSILVDRNGRVIAGNKTLERAADIGLDEVEIVDSDGSKLVAVRRTDLDLETDERARMLAYADNRVGQLDLEFDALQLAADLEAGLDLSALWNGDELAAILEAAGGELLPGLDSWSDAFGKLPDGPKAPFQQMTFTLHDTQAERVKEALNLASQRGDFSYSPNENSNGNALDFICQAFLDER